MTSDKYMPYSQRSGAAPTPSQLKLGEVSSEFKRLLEYYITEEIKGQLSQGYNGPFISGSFEKFCKDFHVKFLGKSIREYKNAVSIQWPRIAAHAREDIPVLFDFIEYVYRHEVMSLGFKQQLRYLFVETRAAYRIVDGLIVAIGTEEQAGAIAKAIDDSEQNFGAARQHLVQAAHKLRSEDWSGCVAESVNAVESVARNLVPEAKTLEPALRLLSEEGRIHPALKQAFSKLYGYSSDEEGVRHALVFQEAAKVDEVDALFMLGACASFVSYLIARQTPTEP